MYLTGSPFRDYKVEYQEKFNNAKEVEKEVQCRLKSMNIKNKNEWYNTSVHLAKRIIESVYDDIENNLMEN